MATSQLDKLKASTEAGQVQINNVSLICATASQGTVDVDIRNIFAELNIYEDLFSGGMYGNILIGDANNILNSLEISGLEGIRIDVQTPGFDDTYKLAKTFGIYSITDHQATNFDRYLTYRLHFASLEVLADALNKPLARQFQGTGSSVVQQIYNQFFSTKGGFPIPRNLKLSNGSTGTPQPSSATELLVGAPDYENKVGTALSDSTKLKFIAAQWSPLRTINYVANKTVSTKKTAGNCLFYENNKGFVFCAIDDLIATGKNQTDDNKQISETQNSPIFPYYYNPANMGDPNAPGLQRDDYERVLNLAWSNNFNVLDQMNMGIFGGQIRNVDPILKRYRERNYSYEKSFNNGWTHTVGGTANPYFPQAPANLLGRAETLIDPRARIMSRNNVEYFLFDKEETPLTVSPDWLTRRAARLASLSQVSANIMIQGRSDMKVGDVISLTYPLYRGDTVQGAQGTDSTLTNFFLVTAIRHFVSPIKYLMMLEIVKDSADLPVDVAPTTPLALNGTAFSSSFEP